MNSYDEQVLKGLRENMAIRRSVEIDLYEYDKVKDADALANVDPDCIKIAESDTKVAFVGW